ncbi:MAG TPA: hypothetical protein VIL36_16850 [Acidimicrobiales bacterium]
MLFTADAREGLLSGAITVTFRRWQRPQVKVGGRYSIWGGAVLLEVDDLRRMPAADIDDADARRAGEADRVAVWRRLTGDRHATEPPAGDVWRIAFHRVEPDGPPLREQADLTAEDVAELDRRLDRLDQASRHGAWTRPTLRLIAERPGVVSTRLAEELGRERFELKADIRKLKRLGLTESLDVGYRISPRGRAYLDRTSAPG